MDKFYKSLLLFALVTGLMGCHSGKNKSPQKKQSSSKGSPHKLSLRGNQKPAPQVNLSDKEAGQFAQAAMNAQKVQMQARQKMMGIIKKDGLDLKTYQKIAAAKHKGKTGKASGISKSNMKKFQQASQDMKKAQSGIRKKIKAAIEKSGMKMKRFRKISRAARQDTTLQHKIRKQIQQLRSESASHHASAK